MHENGEGVTQDQAIAARWYGIAAELGDAESQGRYGYMLIHGVGVSVDIPAGMAWLKRAAECGDAEAQFNYAVMLEKSSPAGVHDSNAAMFWYRRAAANGHEAAAKTLREKSD